MQTQLKAPQVEEIVKKVVQFAQENPLVVGGSAVTTLLASYFLYRRPSTKRDGNDFNNQITGAVKILNNSDHTLKSDQFNKSIDDYNNMFSGARQTTGAITSAESVEVRKQQYADMVNHFYNLVTDFYEWGWGQSFHFAPRFHNETFFESIKRCEHYISGRLGVNKKTRALDVGCGVGGPMREICIYSGSQIDGITINEYQVKIGNKYNQMHGLDHLCKLTQGDFQNLPWPEHAFDVAYEIEATCHSPDRVVTFSGVNRVLKPGGLFAGYEWVMTDKYDPNNADHVRIKEGIEVGNGLPTLQHYSHILECMEKAGFEIIDYFDANENVHKANNLPWYDTLNGKMSLSGFRMTWLGRNITHATVWFLEHILRIAPEGSTKVSALLNSTAIDLVDGGKLEIFTPSFFFIGRKK